MAYVRNTLNEIVDNAILVGEDGTSTAINLVYVASIQEFPQKKKKKGH